MTGSMIQAMEHSIVPDGEGCLLAEAWLPRSNFDRDSAGFAPPHSARQFNWRRGGLNPEEKCKVRVFVVLYWRKGSNPARPPGFRLPSKEHDYKYQAFFCRWPKRVGATAQDDKSASKSDNEMKAAVRNLDCDPSCPNHPFILSSRSCVYVPRQRPSLGIRALMPRKRTRPAIRLTPISINFAWR